MHNCSRYGETGGLERFPHIYIFPPPLTTRGGGAGLCSIAKRNEVALSGRFGVGGGRAGPLVKNQHLSYIESLQYSIRSASFLSLKKG